jgi:Tol biopolymer transport system component/DNA-binding winged helix-turn-helix (wHTH) protein
VPGKVQFGVYEFDPDAMELRKHGVRIHLQEQPFRVLASLIERPGEVVTREQLRERIWSKDTFVDFDQSLNKAVNRLREALNDEASKPRYIETVPRRGYRFVAPVTGIASSATSPAAPPGIPDRTASWPISTKIIAAATLVLAAGITALALLRNPKAPPQPAPTRITTDGNSTQPTLSRDGKLLSYTTVDEQGVGHIWVRQTAGGQSLQVTRGPGAESEPSFSPDGTSIAFRSENNGGGVYIVPTFGGEPKLLAKSAFWPRFSPDGNHIWCLNPVNFEYNGILVTTRGGAPAALPQKLNWLGPFLGYQSVPLWAPSGKQFLYLGRGNGSVETRPSQWRIGSPAGGESRAVNLPDWGGSRERPPFAHAWTQMNDGRQWIVYSVPTGDSLSLFRVGISPKGEIVGKPEQLTSGAELVPNAALSADGKLAFASSSFSEQIYAIPITRKRGVSAQNWPVTRSESLRNGSPSISRDGRWLAYAARNHLGDQTAIRLRDQVTGSDRLLIDGVSPSGDDFLSISPDGSKVLFSGLLGGNDREGVLPCFVISVAGGLPQEVSDKCRAPRGFSSNGSVVLVQKFNPAGPDSITAINLISKQEKVFLTHPRKELFHAFFSWDDHWVVFKTAEDWNHGHLLIAPVRSGIPAGEAEWIAVTDGHHADDKAQFSPDGNHLYFTSDRDGYLGIWAQPLNHATKHPEGEPYITHQFHRAVGWYAQNYVPFTTTLSVTRDRILTNIVETHSDIWMLQVH